MPRRSLQAQTTSSSTVWTMDDFLLATQKVDEDARYAARLKSRLTAMVEQRISTGTILLMPKKLKGCAEVMIWRLFQSCDALHPRRIVWIRDHIEEPYLFTFSQRCVRPVGFVDMKKGLVMEEWMALDQIHVVRRIWFCTRCSEEVEQAEDPHWISCSCGMHEKKLLSCISEKCPATE